jgi:predicted RNA binding protein YcfA (HicA-like mRNA interferase family)
MFERPRSLSEFSVSRSEYATVASITRARDRHGVATGNFAVLRIKGSHHFMQHPDGRRTVVPVHAGETVSPGLLSKILKDAEMDVEEFTK